MCSKDLIFSLKWHGFVFSSPKSKAPGELIGWDSSRRPSVCESTLSNLNLSDQLANQNQISSGASMGCGIDFIRC